MHLHLIRSVLTRCTRTTILPTILAAILTFTLACSPATDHPHHKPRSHPTRHTAVTTIDPPPILDVGTRVAKVYTGKVIKISDGDTFHVLRDDQFTEKIRLYGIDCPERAQAFSQKAKNFLSDLIFGKTVRIVKKDTDLYGRTVAIVFIDTTNVNEALLRASLAWHYTRYDQNPRWADLEKEAETAKRGLWVDPHPTPPWEWRKSNRQN
jgi:endonuclease YncB( thermonuclease family)